MNILEIKTNDIFLSISRGFIVVKCKREEVRKEPLADIDAIIVSGFGIRYSHNLCVRLCEMNIPLILCGKNYIPVGYLISHCSNYEFTGRMNIQLDASEALKKRIWQTIIKKKIRNQRCVLLDNGDYAKDFAKLIEKVRSGDPDNIEAQAAVRYWKRVFGKAFNRDFDEPGINAFLNFGYAIIRSCAIRYCIAFGLLPSIGLHHHNKLNPYCLADDIIEPYRPFVDRKIFTMHVGNEDELNPLHKKELADLCNERFIMDGKRLTLEHCMKQTVISLVRSFKEKKNTIQFPEFYDKRT
ncbi:MAG: type II CRISPR-associated endonuclease Cas1 [Candidatus Cloacimonetes bacterium]|nr:type II CRISPR-associated endonuclease Cas1 [Candidatus Cloacimonadota bacterium]